MGTGWDLNNRFLVITPDLCHTFLGVIVVIHYQNNPGPFLAVDSELKEDLLPQQETNMHVRDYP